MVTTWAIVPLVKHPSVTGSIWFEQRYMEDIVDFPLPGKGEPNGER